MIAYTKSLNDTIISNYLKKMRNIKSMSKITKTIRIHKKKKKNPLNKKIIL